MVSTGRKHSKKRDAILHTLRSTTDHPSAHWVYEHLKPSISDLSLATVYRNINLFIAEGSVLPVCVVDGKERFDGIVEPHPHFVCTKCGQVFDLPYEHLPVLGEAGGFKIDYRKSLFYGLCRHCAE
ncbi:MAG: transcriptional repressor [Spirochaetaceae bacterium]|jgi:Fur family peroxide stress response transcriptional regulator|nr:transcriptional repressor [Spirochaetaceae bacterium]